MRKIELELSDREEVALRELSDQLDMDEIRILHLALRTYQYIRFRENAGDSIFLTIPSEIYGLVGEEGDITNI